MRRIKIPIPVWNTHLTLIIADDVQNAADWISRRHNMDRFDVSTNEAFCAHKPEGGFRHYYMAVTPSIPSHVVVHECVHITTYVLAHRGIEHSAESDEPHAYLTQFLYRQVQEKLARKTEKLE